LQPTAAQIEAAQDLRFCAEPIISARPKLRVNAAPAHKDAVRRRDFYIERHVEGRGPADRGLLLALQRQHLRAKPFGSICLASGRGFSDAGSRSGTFTSSVLKITARKLSARGQRTVDGEVEIAVEETRSLFTSCALREPM